MGTKVFFSLYKHLPIITIIIIIIFVDQDKGAV